jgi:hypothetical protein
VLDGLAKNGKVYRGSKISKLYSFSIKASRCGPEAGKAASSTSGEILGSKNTNCSIKKIFISSCKNRHDRLKIK